MVFDDYSDYDYENRYEDYDVDVFGECFYIIWNWLFFFEEEYVFFVFRCWVMYEDDNDEDEYWLKVLNIFLDFIIILYMVFKLIEV